MTTNNDILNRLATTIAARHPENGGNPDTSYTAKLLQKGPDAFLKKIGEEATEFVMAAKDNDTNKIIYEAADLWFHCMVALSYYNIKPEDILNELARREGVSGLTEKAARKE